MKDYSKQIDKSKEKIAKMKNKIAEMNAELQQEEDNLANLNELDKQEKLMEIARLMSTRGADVNMLFNAVRTGDMYGIQEIFERQNEMKPEQQIPETNENDGESEEPENLTFPEA